MPNTNNIAARERLIVALDYSDQKSALDFVESLGNAVAFYKVGYELFLSAGWPIIERLHEQGHHVFLDLKMDDVPETIEKGVRAVASKGLAAFLTIHGGPATAEAARRGKQDADLKILQITVLTSLGDADMRHLLLVGPDDRYKFHSTAEYVQWRAEQALTHGADGLISSGENARMLRQSLGDAFLLVCPGIRPAEDTTDDHKRPCTPRDAIRDGADYIVVGRPIRNAVNPKGKAHDIIQDIQAGLDDRERVSASD